MIIDNEIKIKRQKEMDEHELQIIMTLYGHKESNSKFLNTKEYKELVNEFINSNIPVNYNFNLKPLTTSQIRRKANKIIREETKGIDLRVPYYPGDSRLIYNYIAETGDNDLEDGYALAHYMKSKMRLINVTKLPIRWDIDEERSGNFNVLHYEIEDEEFLKNCPVVTNGFVMTNENDILSSAHLVHEMTHALTDRNKGIIENILNDEVLTIYMELVAASKLDKNNRLLDIAIRDRIESLKAAVLESLSYNHAGYPEGESLSYLISSLSSFPLFERYINSSEKEKAYLRGEINKTLMGNRTLEDTLKYLDITKDEGSHIIKKEIKRRKK
ncbi:MAG: hypothetical protein IKJ43_02985 [Bacilli bacterium]|nr:hypothetical protein [Bacilli bacterium]